MVNNGHLPYNIIYNHIDSLLIKAILIGLFIRLFIELQFGVETAVRNQPEMTHEAMKGVGGG